MFLVTRQEKFHFPIENFSNLICIKLASLQNLEQDIFPFWIYTAGCNTDICAICYCNLLFLCKHLFCILKHKFEHSHVIVLYLLKNAIYGYYLSVWGSNIRTRDEPIFSYSKTSFQNVSQLLFATTHICMTLKHIC